MKICSSDSLKCASSSLGCEPERSWFQFKRDLWWERTVMNDSIEVDVKVVWCARQML